jgi:hypothetical protein
MINFFGSHFTWESAPWTPDPYYTWAGGFVGKLGQIYHVRFNLEGRCLIRDPTGDSEGAEVFLGAPCRSEYTIAERNLFQVPSTEWRMAFNRERSVAIARRPSWEPEVGDAKSLAEAYPNYRIDVRSYAQFGALEDSSQIVQATLANDLLGVQSTYEDRGLEVTVEFPVNLININADDGEFQICTGPVIVPDLQTWDGSLVSRVFLAHVALTRFDHVEFILQREVAAAPEEREWLDQPRGRDRLELLDPKNEPPGYPPPRPQPTVYNEVWEFAARNKFWRADNT